jgi:hypothetical protein
MVGGRQGMRMLAQGLQRHGGAAQAFDAQADRSLGIAGDDVPAFDRTRRAVQVLEEPCLVERRVPAHHAARDLVVGLELLMEHVARAFGHANQQHRAAEQGAFFGAHVIAARHALEALPADRHGVLQTGFTDQSGQLGSLARSAFAREGEEGQQHGSLRCSAGESMTTSC